MNCYSTENSIAGMPTQFQFHNYDVLLVASAEDDVPRFAQGNHVGNQRFRVLLSLFRERYLQADMVGDENECTSIAHEVLTTVTRKCVPNGRIFEQSRDNKWLQYDHHSSSTMSLIKNALKYDPVEDEIERSPKRVCRSSSGFELLCEAASKELPTQEQEFVESPNPFDVICEADGLGVIQNRKHTGNNRLKVMLDLRMESFIKSSRKGRKAIAEDVVSSVIDDASGRFLLKDKSSGRYIVVSRTSAIVCIRNALATASGIERKNMRESEVRKLQQRKQKKAILDRFEKRKGGNSDLCSFMSSAPPTRFNIAFPKHKALVPRAA